MVVVREVSFLFLNLENFRKSAFEVRDIGVFTAYNRHIDEFSADCDNIEVTRKECEGKIKLFGVFESIGDDCVLIRPYFWNSLPLKCLVFPIFQKLVRCKPKVGTARRSRLIQGGVSPRRL